MSREQQAPERKEKTPSFGTDKVTPLVGIDAICKEVGYGALMVLDHRQISNIPIAQFDGVWCSTVELIGEWHAKAILDKGMDKSINWEKIIPELIAKHYKK